MANRSVFSSASLRGGPGNAWEVWSNAFTYICSSIWTQVLSRPTKRHGAILGPMFFIQIPNRVLKSFPLKHWVFFPSKHDIMMTSDDLL